MSEQRQWYRKWWVILLVIIFLLIATGLGAKAYLYVKFLLGNDIVVKLNANKEVFSMERGQEEELTFRSSITTNPFCTATCTAQFADISNNRSIEETEFRLKTGIPSKSSYILAPPSYGTGQVLYNYRLSCRSTPTTLCHTTGDATTRSLLITVNYNLNATEQELKAALQGRFSQTISKLSLWKGMIAAFNTVKITTPISKQDLRVLENETDSLQGQLKQIEQPWMQQRFDDVHDSLAAVTDSVMQTESRIIAMNNSITGAFLAYNALIDELSAAKTRLEMLKTHTVVNKTVAFELNNAINLYNEAVIAYTQTRAQLAINKTYAAEKMIKDDIRKQTLLLGLTADREYDTICLLSGDCTSHPTLLQRANQTFFNLAVACGELTKVRNTYIEINKTLPARIAAANYSDGLDFWTDIHIKAQNLKKNITNNYRAAIPERMNNSALLLELLPEQIPFPTKSYDKDLVPALLSKLVEQRPLPCEIYTTTTDTLTVAEPKLELPAITAFAINLTFDEPNPMCCAFGRCSACGQNPAAYPVLLLHGHAFNQDLSAEYSLDIFNRLQNRLEQDGYINAGAITVYTELDVPQGIWGMTNNPLTVKVSYYFDIFHEPENYVVVQANSENIDTYAIRLKDLIDTVTYKTGKQKVIIVAHSMGGLVARRYMQIFGSDKVDRIILAGTPNKGIVGDVLTYCPLIGENLECRDMNAESLFMNKLNRAKLPVIPIVNIVGTGCQMKDGIGDGVVLEENAKLEGAENILVQGSCKGVDLLHTSMLNIERYPAMYDAITKALNKTP